MDINVILCQAGSSEKLDRLDVDYGCPIPYDHHVFNVHPLVLIDDVHLCVKHLF